MQGRRKLGQEGRGRAYASGGGAGPLVRTQKRVPRSRSAHQTIGKCMKACAQTVGSAHMRDDRVQGRRGAGQSDLCAESVRTRARVEGVCVRMRARGETLWSGRLTFPTRQVGAQEKISSSTFCLSGELIPTEWEKNLCYRQNGVAGSPFVHDSIIICTISSLL